MLKVYAVKQLDYTQEQVNASIKLIFDKFGGIEKFVSRGNSVLLKANMLGAHSVEKRVTTDPAVVRSVALEVMRAGGTPIIGDSPGLDKFSSVGKKSGLSALAQELDIECVELKDPVLLPYIEDALFRKIEVSRTVLDSDVIINLPKMKTHGQMLLTLGVKNLFGTIVAQRKAEWHYKVGLRRDVFASLLIDIYRGVKPSFTVLDGIWGMDGSGPSNGTPRNFGILAGAEDALVLDFHICKLLGLPLEQFPLWQAASSRNMAESLVNDNELDGDFLHPFVFKNVNIPRLSTLRVMPKVPFLEPLLTSSPFQDILKCTKCGRCTQICPANAVKLNADKRLVFDYDRCIRCYCCHEFCPNDAIGFKDGLLLKLMKLIKR